MHEILGLNSPFFLSQWNIVMIDSAGGARPLRGRAPTPEQIDQQFQDVSKLYEKQFLREMVKAMRSTVHESGFIKQNQGEKIFREQLDQENVEKWGDRGGIGLADMIYKQLVDRYGEAAGLKQRVDKVNGPISVEHLAQFQVRQQTNPGNFPVTYEFEKKSLEDSALMNLQSPLAGRIARNVKLGADQTLLEIMHEDGLQSRMVFRGHSPSLVQGQMVDQGETVGLLSPEARSFFWALGLDQKTVPE